jgi:outer membrane lipoprotein SlyB
MASMTAAQQKNLREVILFGSVINQEGAIMEATIPAQAELTRSFKELYDSNQLNAENVSRLKSQKSQEIQRQGQAQAGLGQAGYFGGIAGASAQAINELMKDSRKYTEAAVAGGIAATKGQATTKDPLTASVTDAVLAVEAMRVEMEKLVMDSGALAKFGEMLSQITKVMAEGLKELGGAVTGDTTKGAAIGSSIGDVAGSGLGAAAGGALAGRVLAGRAAGGLAGRALGGLGGSLLGPAGMIAGGALGSVLGDYLGGKLGEAISGLLGGGKALGGISAGPDSGYLEKLHGVEAVVPLPDGRSIPVTMDSSGDSAMLNLMKEQVELFKNMLDSLRNSEDLQDRMLSNSY